MLPVYFTSIFDAYGLKDFRDFPDFLEFLYLPINIKKNSMESRCIIEWFEFRSCEQIMNQSKKEFEFLAKQENLKCDFRYYFWDYLTVTMLCGKIPRFSGNSRAN